jgi:hypothetical protein
MEFESEQQFVTEQQCTEILPAKEYKDVAYMQVNMVTVDVP